MLTKASVMAPEIPARDQPVSAPIGSRNTASENTTPMATQVIRAPAATRGQLRSAASSGAGEEFMLGDLEGCSLNDERRLPK